MNNIVASILLIPLILILLLLIPELAIYGIKTTKANNFVTQAVEVGEKNGGFQYSTSTKNVDFLPKIKKELKELNLGDFQYSYTQGRVDYNEDVKFSLKGSHNFFILKMIGIDSFKLPIYASRKGTSQVYVRD